MKKHIVLLLCFTAQTALAQESSIQLKQCIDAAMTNKANIKASRTDLVVAGLQREEARGRYLPDISVLYEYRYNPIIPTQVVPTGQFLPVPTDELRPIRFGTDWQQNAGLTVYQPIIDGTIKNRIEESRINERVKQADLRIAEEELAYEVLSSFSNIMQLTEQVSGNAADTARTHRTLSYIHDRYTEGKLLKTELNNAKRNHANALSALYTAKADLVKEKLYLGYLTGIDAPELLSRPFDFAPLQELVVGGNEMMIDSIGTYRQLAERRALLGAQARTEQRRPLPSLGFQGFLGANQFTNNLNPFESNSWFGSSYVGLQVKVPILSSENRSVKIKQYAEQQVALGFQQEDLKQQMLSDYRRAEIDLLRTRQEIALAAENVMLLEENVRIYQDRVEAGRENSHQLLLQEIDLQQEKALLRKLQADQANRQVELLKASGRLMDFVRGL